jgi:hypothetical protein
MIATKIKRKNIYIYIRNFRKKITHNTIAKNFDFFNDSNLNFFFSLIHPIQYKDKSWDLFYVFYILKVQKHQNVF